MVPCTSVLTTQMTRLVLVVQDLGVAKPRRVVMRSRIFAGFSGTQMERGGASMRLLLIEPGVVRFLIA